MLFFMKKWNEVAKYLSCVSPYKNELTLVMEHGEARVQKSLDIVKICNDIKYLKLLAKF